MINFIFGVCILLGFVFFCYTINLIFSYWKERLAARAWWREQTNAERRIDKQFGF